MNDDDNFHNRKTEGKRRIQISYISDRDRRLTTFSKRRDGLMKKGFELYKITGSEVLIVVASETAHIYSFSTPNFQPFIGKLINNGEMDDFVAPINSEQKRTSKSKKKIHEEKRTQNSQPTKKTNSTKKTKELLNSIKKTNSIEIQECIKIS